MEVLERAGGLERAGRSIVHLEVGEPDFKTPEVIVSAMKEALAGGRFGYTHSLGDPELREALSLHYKTHYGLDIEPGRFLVCPGSSIGLTLLFGALLEPGDRVLISSPHYACYPNFVRFAGGEPVFAPAEESDGFRPDPERLRGILKKEKGVKALIVNSPANPTGAVMEERRLKEIAGLPVLAVSDEIYHGLNYTGGRDRSILEFADRAVVAGGFSKAFAMTGWRVGYLVLPPELVRPMQALAQNFLISVSAAAQRAAIAALDGAWPEVLKMRAVYDERRRHMVAALRDLGLGVAAEPEGAFYVLANARRVCPDSLALCFEILERAGVGCAPGSDFGPAAEGFLRFSYAASLESIKEGMSRLKAFLAARG
jgi:aspartate/methionine/tyrosine aminotransferase